MEKLITHSFSSASKTRFLALSLAALSLCACQTTSNVTQRADGYFELKTEAGAGGSSENWAQRETRMFCNNQNKGPNVKESFIKKQANGKMILTIVFTCS